ncbi:MAG: hypothetical protein DRP47_00250, partial [Candidatus Zixiibacteriota bacterium]
NPFNGCTTIPFYVPHSEKVELSIFNVLGEQVYCHISKFSEGNHQITWEGTDYNNLPVASGVYYYRLKTNEDVITRKMLLVK